MSDEHDVEIDRNYDFFQRHLSEWLGQHAGEYALLYRQELEGFYPDVASAVGEAFRRFGRKSYSIQHVTTEPDSLGHWSHQLHV